MDSHTEIESYLATVWVTCIVLPRSNKSPSLDEKPGFSLDLVKLIVEEDFIGDIRGIVRKGLVQAVVTGCEFIGIYGKIFEKHPKSALEVIEGMQLTIEPWVPHEPL